MDVDIKEFARQKQVISATIADLVAQAKAILMDAKQIAKDAGMEVSFDNMITEMNSETSWYNSNDTC